MMATKKQVRRILRDADKLWAVAYNSPAMVDDCTDWDVVIAAGTLHLARMFVLQQVFTGEVAIRPNSDDLDIYEVMVGKKLQEALSSFREDEL